MSEKEKYGQALERAKLAIKECGNNKGRISMIEAIFPELREGEKEKKEIYDFISWARDRGCITMEQREKVDSWMAWLEKQSGEKPSWSEEDEKKRKRIIGLLEGWMPTFKKTCYAEDWKCCIDWLKALKYRCIWKPSEEHIKAVRLARSFVTDDFSEHPMLSEILIDLEEQLKKLREE